MRTDTYEPPSPHVDLPEEWVLARVRELLDSNYEEFTLHGVRAIDVTRGQRRYGRALTWYDAFPVLERLTNRGRLVRVVLTSEPCVPRYREVGS